MTDSYDERRRLLEDAALKQRELLMEIYHEAVRVKLIEPCPVCKSGNVPFQNVHKKIMEALANYRPDQKSG